MAPADYTEEYLCIGQNTTTQSMRRFTKMVIRLYVDWYLLQASYKEIDGDK
jgi:hypothetical protein